MQCMHVGVADVKFRASEFIEMTAEIIQSDILDFESLINADNVLAKYVGTHGSYNKVGSERLIQKHLLETLTEEEHCNLHIAVDQCLNSFPIISMPIETHTLAKV